MPAWKRIIYHIPDKNVGGFVRDARSSAWLYNIYSFTRIHDNIHMYYVAHMEMAHMYGCEQQQPVEQILKYTNGLEFIG